MKRRRPPDPQTPEEWQKAVDAAAGVRAIADCKIYGLLEGGPEINVARCDEILKRGAALGIRPSGPVIELAVGLVVRCALRGERGALRPWIERLQKSGGER